AISCLRAGDFVALAAGRRAVDCSREAAAGAGITGLYARIAGANAVVASAEFSAKRRAESRSARRGGHSCGTDREGARAGALDLLRLWSDRVCLYRLRERGGRRAGRRRCPAGERGAGG